MNLHWPESPDDDPGYMKCAKELVAGVATMSSRFYVFRINNWFGPKWLGFCGKVMGAFGVAEMGKVVVPPFVQSRITAQSLFEANGEGAFIYRGSGPQIHHVGRSIDNSENLASKAAPQTTLFWISGNSLANGRGTVMVYRPGPENYLTFYVEFQKRNDQWSVSQHKDITPEMVPIFQSWAVKYMESDAIGINDDSPPHTPL